MIMAEASHVEPSGQTKPKGSSWLLRACVLAFMLVVILGECLVAYKYLHTDKAASSEDPHAAAEKKEHEEAEPAADAEHGHGHEGEEKHEPEEKGKDAHGGHEPATAGKHDDHSKTGQAPQIEMDLGDFSVTIFQPASNTTLRIDFHLFGAIRLDNESEFKARMEEHKHRFRDQVLVTIRSSDVSDLADPGLGLIKRKILAKTNETLGKPLLRSVIFSEFSFIEQ
jgi:flagellar FliL protein